MSHRGPVRADRRTMIGPPPEARAASSRSTSRSATASPPAPAARPARPGPSASRPALRARNPRLAYRNLAVEGATSAEVLEQLAGGARARARPGHGRLRRQRRARARPAPTPTATPGASAAILGRLQRREPGGARSSPRPRPSAGTSSSSGRARGRGSSAASRALNRATRVVAARLRRPLPRGRRPSRALASRRTSAPTACTPRRSATGAPRAASRELLRDRCRDRDRESKEERHETSCAPERRRRADRRAGGTITEADLVSFAALTGDWHPQHADAEWAAAGRFGERVAHGMLVLSYAVGLVPFDPERVVALRGLDSVTFKRPVRIGDTIRVRSTGRAGAASSTPSTRWSPSPGGSSTRTTGAGRPRPGRGAVALDAGRRRDRRAQRRRARTHDRRRRAGAAVILDGKRILVTGRRQPPLDRLRDRRARPASRAPRCVLTSFGRMRRMTERAAKRLPEPARRARARRQQRRGPGGARRRRSPSRWGRVDGAVHAIAHAPPDALGGDFLAAPARERRARRSRPAPTR